MTERARIIYFAHDVQTGPDAIDRGRSIDVEGQRATQGVQGEDTFRRMTVEIERDKGIVTIRHPRIDQQTGEPFVRVVNWSCVVDYSPLTPKQEAALYPWEKTKR